MKGLDYLKIDFMSQPKPCKLILVLDTQSFYEPDSLNHCESLLQNTWGEIFYSSLPLSHIEDVKQKCYAIARYLNSYLAKATPGKFSYEIIHLKIHNDNDIIKRIKKILSDMSSDTFAPLNEVDAILASINMDRNQPFLLDR